MQKLRLVVRIKGAIDEELQRAGVAAMAVFGKHDVTSLEEPRLRSPATAMTYRGSILPTKDTTRKTPR